MKIKYDHLCFWEDYGGVSRYFVELIKNMPPENVSLSLKYSNNEYLKQLKDIKVNAFLPNIRIKGKPRVIKEIGKLFSAPALLKGNFDIYHPTHYDTYGLSIVPKHVRTVATIHDMNFFVIPSYYDGRISTLAKQQCDMAKRVDHIITISQNTKKDLKDIWNIPDEKISVIYHGINHPEIVNYSTRIIDRPYILFVGRRTLYKNFIGLLKAFHILSAQHKDCLLICTGSKFTKEEENLLADLNLTNRCRSIQATDSQLWQLYAQAEMFVFPSLYEGFGMPILEAMSNHCPVVLAQASCFPEIAADAALYFNPDKPEDIADKISRVLGSDSLRNDLIERGDRRVKDFSWQKSAAKHLEVYKTLL